MKKLLALVITGLISVTASATNWVLINQSNTASSYVDTDSITSIYLDNSIYGKTNNRKSYKQAFYSINYNEPKELNPNKTYTSTIMLKQYDCKSSPKKSRWVSAILRNGSDLVTSFDDSDHDWDVQYPETIGEFETNFVCSY